MAVLATGTVTLAVAVDVQQVDTYYYQTASTGTAPSKPTAASPSGWQTAEYAFDASKAVWSCQKTTLTDGTFYWGAVSKWSAYEGSVVAWNKADAAQESIDNLEVGGRNLVWDTAYADVANRWSAWGSPTTREIVEIDGQRWLHLVSSGANYEGHQQNSLKRSGLVGEITPGDKIVVSFTAWGKNGGERGCVGIHFRNAERNQIVHQDWVSVTLTDKKARYVSSVFTVRNNEVEFNVMVGHNNTNVDELWIGEVKIEKGNVATDWTPAPEDVEAAIEEAAKVAGNYIVETATNDVWVHSENHGPNSSGVATADTYGWRIGSVFELVRAGLSYFKMWVENSVAKVRVGLENAGHSVFSPDGMEVFTDSTTSVARFGSTARVGESAKAHVNITGSATEFYAEDGSTKLAEITTYNSNPRFYIGQSGTTFMVTSGDSNTDYLLIGNYGYNNGQKEAAIELLAEGVGHTSFNVVSANIEGNDDEVFIGPSKAYFGAMDIKTEGAVYASKFGAIGTKQSDELSSSTSLSNGTTKAVASVSLAAGTWVVVGHAVFASNTSGVRSLGIGSTANSLSYTDLSCVTVRPASGADTRLQSTSIVSPTSTTTYYLNAYQNSGSSMNCTSAKLTAIRIA